VVYNVPIIKDKNPNCPFAGDHSEEKSVFERGVLNKRGNALIISIISIKKIKKLIKRTEIYINFEEKESLNLLPNILKD